MCGTEKCSGGGLIMRMQILSGLMAAAVIAGAALWAPTADMRAEAGQIDFANLHDQATSAMRELQMAQERRLTSRQTAEF
jgi:hypothetical protein